MGNTGVRAAYAAVKGTIKGHAGNFPTSPSLLAPARRQPSRRSEPKPIDDVFTKVGGGSTANCAAGTTCACMNLNPGGRVHCGRFRKHGGFFLHTKRNAVGTETATRFPVFGALRQYTIWKEADKKLSADVDLCAGFLSTIPDDVLWRPNRVSGENFEKLSDGSSHRNGETA